MSTRWPHAHAHIDARSLAMAREIALRLRNRPAFLEEARERLRRWETRNGPKAPGIQSWKEWLSLIDEGVDAVIDALCAEDDRGQQLRQNSPFVGVLSNKEVWAFKRAFSPCNEPNSNT
ncbi:MAG: hypothetical protein ABF370_17070 [Verrucomicrobiales bacterium]|nr:hypothetical protein [Verrucomicrobiaceae bacterium]